MKYPPVIIVQLIHIYGPLKGKIQEFSEPLITIGRHPSSNLCFPADLTIVSRKHAEIIREGNRFKLVDHSANGTFLNGKRVQDAYLKNGDVLMFAEGGPKVSFITQIKEGKFEPESPQSQYPQEKASASGNQEPPVLSEPRPSFDQKIERPAKPTIQTAKAPLIIQYGPTLRSFKELPITIGKHPSCDFIINHPSILDRHAQVFFGQDFYWVKDLTGQGLIQVNHQPILIETLLKPNDLVALSPQGPVFSFLGEGRLAEVEGPPIKESFSPTDDKRGKSQQDKANKEHSEEGPLSFFKKMLK